MNVSYDTRVLSLFLDELIDFALQLSRIAVHERTR
jgi:hypothetical protein